MRQVTIHAAKTQLSRLNEAAVAGEDVVIAKGSKPIPRLVPNTRRGSSASACWPVRFLQQRVRAHGRGRAGSLGRRGLKAVLMDTHAWAWSLMGSDRLSGRAMRRHRPRPRSLCWSVRSQFSRSAPESPPGPLAGDGVVPGPAAQAARRTGRRHRQSRSRYLCDRRSDGLAPPADPFDQLVGGHRPEARHAGPGVRWAGPSDLVRPAHPASALGFAPRPLADRPLASIGLWARRP